MKARQEVHCCFETRRTRRAAKDERHYLLSCLMTFCHCPFLRPQWLAGFMHGDIFEILKLENEEGNMFSFNDAMDGRVEQQLMWCRKLPIFAFSQSWGLIISFVYCKRESSSLFFVVFIVVVEEIYTSVASGSGDMWAHNVCCLLFFLHYDSFKRFFSL